MKRFTTLLLAGTLLAGGFAQADAASLRDAARISGSQIRLGDLFDGLDSDTAERAVAAAPEPGRRVSLDPADLTRIATANGLDWRPATGADRIMVERMTVTIGPERIQDILADALADAGVESRLDLALDNRTLALHLPSGVDDTVLVENLNYDAGRGRVSADLVAPAAGLRQSIGARAVEVVEVPVPNRRLMPGDIITEADLDWTIVRRDRAGADSVLAAEELIGQTVRRAAAAHRPLRTRDVRAPVVVPRGGVVTILLQTPTMTLTAQGRALADGAVGEVIRVANTTSSRVIDAKVASDGVVTVLPTGAAQFTAASN